jgi:hypothetical protein
LSRTQTKQILALKTDLIPEDREGNRELIAMNKRFLHLYSVFSGTLIHNRSGHKEQSTTTKVSGNPFKALKTTRTKILHVYNSFKFIRCLTFRFWTGD